MLEMLYASGLRVSELVTLKAAQVSHDMGVVRVMGKGSKERLVPLGEEALAWLARYHARSAARAARRQACSDDLFVTARGGRDDAPGVLVSHQALRCARRARQVDLAAHAAPRVRDASPQPRRGPARGAAAARTLGYFDDADLHARRARAAEAAPCEASPARARSVRLSALRLHAALDRHARAASRLSARRASSRSRGPTARRTR